LNSLKIPENNKITIQTKSEIKLLSIRKNIFLECDDKSIISLKTIFESDFGATAVKNLLLDTMSSSIANI
jgi:hypothetical protein